MMTHVVSGVGRIADLQPVVRDVLSAVRSEHPPVQVFDHPLGFLHFELPVTEAAPTGSRLRLHLWDEQAPGEDQLGRFHDHAWGLRSLVVAGRLEDCLYDVEYRSDGSVQEVLVHYARGIERVQSGRSADLRLASTRLVEAGSRYEIDASIVHATTVLVRPTVTLVVTSPATSTAARVFAPHGVSGSGASIRRAVDYSDALERLEAALDIT